MSATATETRLGRGGARIVLTAPLTETIDHAGYFIQMSMASLPMWLEGIINRKYPHWRELEYNGDGTARYMPAGVRVLETSLLRRFPASDIVCCYPADLDRFIGPDTRVVAVSTHNPLGVTFAAGVYTSIFGSTSQPINSHYARELFLQIKHNPHRARYQVMVGGSGGWQIIQTNSYEDLGVDCVVEGRSESEATLDLFEQALRGERLPKQVDVPHPKSRDEILFPDKRTTFGVVEMTTGCGRRCQFCVPDLNPQIDLPKDKILSAVRANVRDGNKQISLATEDMFIWGQVHTPTPFYFPNREALVDLYASIVDTPGVEEHVLSHSTIAPAVVDPVLIEQLTATIIDKSPIHIPLLSTAPEEEGAGPAHRPRNRVDPHGQADHAEQGRAVPDRRVAERGHPRPGDPEQAQLVPGHDAHRRQPGRDRRRLQGDARPDLRGGAARPVRLLHPLDLHAAPRHAHGEEEGRHRNRAADAAAVAADDEVLEDEPAAGPGELVGADGMAHRRAGALGLEAAQAERPRVHVAALHVRERAARTRSWARWARFTSAGPSR